MRPYVITVGLYVCLELLSGWDPVYKLGGVIALVISIAISFIIPTRNTVLPNQSKFRGTQFYPINQNSEEHNSTKSTKIPRNTVLPYQSKFRGTQFYPINQNSEEHNSTQSIKIPRKTILPNQSKFRGTQFYPINQNSEEHNSIQSIKYHSEQ